MKNSLLLPSRFGYLGMALMIGGAISILFTIPNYSSSHSQHFSLAMLIEMIGALIAMCSREKEEDELIAGLRLQSFFLATLFVSVLVIIFKLAGLIFNFSTAVDVALPIVILQAFYFCYFLYVRRNWLFLKKSK
ncbi:hypothetical protein ABIB40_001154 [Pedobacter sp. UYP30]|uniref:hypothetical protein n=1 Tax=Pedobacter sp. UYP30 TaxID=1756400 RepID=UPI00339671D5